MPLPENKNSNMLSGLSSYDCWITMYLLQDKFQQIIGRDDMIISYNILKRNHFML